MGFIKWRFPHYYCYFWGGHYRLLQPGLALVKWSLQLLCHFSPHPSFTLGSHGPKSLHAPHGIFQGSQSCFHLRGETTQQKENSGWVTKTNICSVSCSRRPQARTWKGMGSLCFVYRVKADETTLWGQEAARPQQTKNKETVRLHTADVSDGAHICCSGVFYLKCLG